MLDYAEREEGIKIVAFSEKVIDWVTRLDQEVHAWRSTMSWNCCCDGENDCLCEPGFAGIEKA